MKRKLASSEEAYDVAVTKLDCERILWNNRCHSRVAAGSRQTFESDLLAPVSLPFFYNPPESEIANDLGAHGYFFDSEINQCAGNVREQGTKRA